MTNLSAEYRSNNYRPSVLITFLAKVFSYVFHPLFIPLYVGYYLIFVNHAYFAGFGEKAKTWVMVRILLNMVFFPLFTVALLKALGFIDSIFLKKQRDRIVPYMASGIFFFWMYLVFRNQPEIPRILTSFTFGVFLASSFALIANVYFKISMHAVGCGGMLGLMIVVLNYNVSAPFTIPFMIAVIITGIVCTSRLIVSDHTQKDIYMGLFWGFISQIIAGAFLL